MKLLILRAKLISNTLSKRILLFDQIGERPSGAAMFRLVQQDKTLSEVSSETRAGVKRPSKIRTGPRVKTTKVSTKLDLLILFIRPNYKDASIKAILALIHIKAELNYRWRKIRGSSTRSLHI